MLPCVYFTSLENEKEKRINSESVCQCSQQRQQESEVSFFSKEKYQWLRPGMKISLHLLLEILLHRPTQIPKESERSYFPTRSGRKTFLVLHYEPKTNVSPALPNSIQPTDSLLDAVHFDSILSKCTCAQFPQQTSSHQSGPVNCVIHILLGGYWALLLHSREHSN